MCALVTVVQTCALPIYLSLLHLRADRVAVPGQALAGHDRTSVRLSGSSIDGTGPTSTAIGGGVRPRMRTWTAAPAFSAASSAGVGIHAVIIAGVSGPFTVQWINSSRIGRPLDRKSTRLNSSH